RLERGCAVDPLVGVVHRAGFVEHDVNVERRYLAFGVAAGACAAEAPGHAPIAAAQAAGARDDEAHAAASHPAGLRTARLGAGLRAARLGAGLHARLGGSGASCAEVRVVRRGAARSAAEGSRAQPDGCNEGSPTCRARPCLAIATFESK